MTVLIVEDNAAIRRVIRSVISDLAEVVECTNGAQALPAYEQCRPDWVFMDIRMGEVNGIEASRRIRAAHPAARIIIVTDYDDAVLREAARAAGASHYVLKENLFEVRRIISGPGIL
jgi:CheY-like chemotaxis protein